MSQICLNTIVVDMPRTTQYQSGGRPIPGGGHTFTNATYDRCQLWRGHPGACSAVRR